MSSDEDDSRYEYDERPANVQLHENPMDGGTEAVLSNDDYKSQQVKKRRRRKKPLSKDKRSQPPTRDRYKNNDNLYYHDNHEGDSFDNIDDDHDDGYDEDRSHNIRQRKRPPKKRENLRTDMQKSKSMFISRASTTENKGAFKRSSSFNDDLESYEEDQDHLRYTGSPIREISDQKREGRKTSNQKRRSVERKKTRPRNSSSEHRPDSDDYEKKRIPLQHRKDSNGSNVTKRNQKKSEEKRSEESRTTESADLEKGPTNTSNMGTIKKNHKSKTGHQTRPQSNPKRPISNTKKDNNDSHDGTTIHTQHTGNSTHESTIQTIEEKHRKLDFRFHVGNKPRPKLKKDRSFTEISATGTVVTRDLDCEPYKQDIIDELIRKAQNPSLPNGYHDVIKQLIEFGVTVYEIGYQSLQEDGDLIGEIKNVTQEVAHLIRTPKHGLDERCLLYRDKFGRPYNLVIVGGSSGLTSAWKSSLATFSGLEAIMALAVLSRSFSCGVEGNEEIHLNLICFEYFSPFLYFAILFSGRFGC